MKSPTQIEELWKSLAERPVVGPAVRRVDESHPWELFACRGHDGKPSLILLSNSAPTVLPGYDALRVSANLRSDGKWATALELARTEFEPFFALVCQDVIDASRVAPPEQGPDFVIRRLDRWRRLMEAARRRVLSEEELRGLVGELRYLADVAIPKWGEELSVNAWLGPSGSPQDFSLVGKLIEVKSYTPGSGKVAISSLAQLTTDGTPLFLAVVPLAKVDKHFGGSFTPWELVEQIRNRLTNVPTARTEFEMRLIEADFLECDEYKSVWYHAGPVRHFEVSTGFPCLTRQSVPAAIIDAIYQLELTGCSEFECEL